MKAKIIIVAAIIMNLSILFCEENTTATKPVKKIVDKDTEQIIIEVKKPDNAAVMNKRKTEFKHQVVMNLKPIIKKSNKLLY